MFLRRESTTAQFESLTLWVADVTQRQVIQDLESWPNLVYVNRDPNIWDAPVEHDLANALAVLDDDYVQIETNCYATLDLSQDCPNGEEQYKSQC